jgi:hypothetical protein
LLKLGGIVVIAFVAGLGFASALNLPRPGRAESAPWRSRGRPGPSGPPGTNDIVIIDTNSAHQPILDPVPSQISDGGEVELAGDGALEQLGGEPDLRQVEAGVGGERAQRAELAARRREALLRAVEVEKIDHELDGRLDVRGARDLLEEAEVRRQLGVIEVRRHPRPPRGIAARAFSATLSCAISR